MVNKIIIRIMVGAIILFLWPHSRSFSQCKASHSLSETALIKGALRGTGYYYRNLIIQDLALAAGISIHEVTLRLDYHLHVTYDQCTLHRLEIAVRPVDARCNPYLYREFDVSASLVPSAADLVFYIRNQLGIISDSIVINNFPLREKTGKPFVWLMDINPLEGRVTPFFARAVFHYDQQAYDAFRDHVLIIDEYYAAAALADSVYRLIGGGFLSEKGTCGELFLRQAEIERMARYVTPGKFDSLTVSGHYDPARLQEKHLRLIRYGTRYKTLLEQPGLARRCFPSPGMTDLMISSWLGWQDHYRRMAYHTDYKFINFFEDVAVPSFSTAILWSGYGRLREFGLKPGLCQRAVAGKICGALTERAERFENAGSQIHALRYYESALSLARLTHLRQQEKFALEKVCRMKQEVLYSYLRISGLASGRDNPLLAVQYFRRAGDIYQSNHLPCLDQDTLARFERSMYRDFESRVPLLIGDGAFRKAAAFLQEIRSRCQESPAWQCPGELTEWSAAVSQGIYDELIRDVRHWMAREELAEAEQIYRQAGNMRATGAYPIVPAPDEQKMGNRFRQMYYDDFVDEGTRYFDKAEYDLALYYFSKAYHLQNGNLLAQRIELPQYRRESARHVIEKLFSDTRLKIWAHDLETAGHYMEQAGSMMAEYNIASGDPLRVEYERLKNEVFTSQCIAARNVFDDLMEQVFKKREAQDFSTALSLANEAVNHSLNHISCKIRDDQAWYQKVVLEPLAGYQQKEMALQQLAYGPPEPYLNAFRELNSYYSRQKLLEQGVIFIPLKERVLKAEDIDFLTGMYDHYVWMNDPGQCLALLVVLHQKGAERKMMSGRQWNLAKLIAKDDVKNLGTETMPWEFMRAHVGTDPWFRPFRWSYKLAWIRETRGKIRYWPLIWKK